ncbi:SO_0444 family Cu/Zn efflux transporter [Motilimonas pumila]|uniref:Permease n=1 Tax=Motilimonas pumila TaxID=2303987 RepID=A0A418YFA0_9GAMM|nr:SO_0444 family Cu/Zn efflux transporter [Motilimonas pumila]RJG47876.1 permease [Motilimonas pumila]
MLIENFIDLFLESAPWMMLGLLIAGLIKEFIPGDFLTRHLGGKGFWVTVKAAFIGAPLPLCSCGVIPAALGLRRNGASKSATTAFLVATPETGVDSVSVSYALLGPFMAIIRPVAAVVSAIVAGLIVGKDDADRPASKVHSGRHKSAEANQDGCCGDKVAQPRVPNDKQTTTRSQPGCCSAPAEPPKPVVSSCCSSNNNDDEAVSGCSGNKGAVAATSVAISDSVSSCCSNDSEQAKSQSEVNKRSVGQKVFGGVSFAATDLVRDISLWLLVGLFFAALVETYVATDYLAQWGDSIWAMLLMVAISVPMYICATASTPIAAGLLLSGISPGAVLVFMMAGPATNVATLGVVGKELGKRALLAYLVGVIGMAIVFGLLTNYLVAEFGFVVAPISAMDHALLPHWLTISSSVLLAGLMLRVGWQKLSLKLAHSE